jgi:phosphoserine phosphatase
MKSGVLALIASVAALVATPARADDPPPLPSWYDCPAKKAITDFVARVNRDGIPPAERIAVFDNDGTLWSEQPIYFQAMFAIDRIRSEGHKHPDWHEKQPFKGILEWDLNAALASLKHPAIELVMYSHAGRTTEEFKNDVNEWLENARHPRCQRRYTDLVYQPMLEVLKYLQANKFKTYIVSGGDVEFMKPLASKFYCIPPEQVIGSSIKTSFEIRCGTPVLVRQSEIEFICDGPGKPAAIYKFIGRRPVMAFGNSDGDLQMFKWTTARPEPGFSLIVHHTDAVREWAYDHVTHAGRLDWALEFARDLENQNRWTVVDMEKDWKFIYPRPK